MTTMEPITVVCRPDDRGWWCMVQVGSDDRTTQHDVSVSPDELDRLAPGLSEPTSLVELSFRFLLEREPKESILRTFALSDIERYFPEYRTVIGKGVATRQGAYLSSQLP